MLQPTQPIHLEPRLRTAAPEMPGGACPGGGWGLASTCSEGEDEDETKGEDEGEAKTVCGLRGLAWSREGHAVLT